MLTTKKYFIIVFNFFFLFIFCHAPYSALHAQPEIPKDFQLGVNGDTGDGNGDTGGCNGDTTGTTYYISNSGDDNADALTPASAWKTVKKVNNSTFSPGDHICFQRGDTWNEQLVISSSGNASDYIIFGAYGSGNKPVFDGTGVSISKTYSALVQVQMKDYIIVENLRVTDSADTKGTEVAAINFENSDYGIVRNSETYNSEAAGIRGKNADKFIVENNTVDLACVNSRSESISIENCGGFEIRYNTITNGGTHTGGGSGIDAKNGSHSGTIHHNEVYDFDQNGIYVDSFSRHTYDIEVYNNHVNSGKTKLAAGISLGAEDEGLLENITVHHNIIDGAAGSGIEIHDGGNQGQPGANPMSGIKIYNNTVVYSGYHGGWIGGIGVDNADAEDVEIKNNIVVWNDDYQIGIRDDSAPSPGEVVIDHNVIYGDWDKSGAYTAKLGANSIRLDPLFVSTDDYHLQSTSPAKNACDNSVWQGTPNITDYDGVHITNGAGNIVAPGGRVSCGAYE